MMRNLNWLLVLFLAVSIINYPNPCNLTGGEVVSFECTSTQTTEAYLFIYDMSARFILRKPFPLNGSATNYLTWDGYSNYHELVGNGIYLYQLLTRSGSRLGKGKIWIINK